MVSPENGENISKKLFKIVGFLFKKKHCKKFIRADLTNTFGLVYVNNTFQLVFSFLIGWFLNKDI